jgi:uncharacterized protein YbjT (DUF2867 family)
MRVAVFGATGFIGGALLPVLGSRHQVVGVSRRPRRSDPPGAAGWLEADVLDPEAVRAVLEGVDVAYYLVHSLGARDFEERDARAAENVARAAEDAGVRRLVYLGGLGDDAPDLSSHLRSRRETGLRLASGSVPVTTLRAAVVVGRGSAAFETIVALVERLPMMLCPRWVTTPTQPIALADVVHYLSEAADRPDLDGQTFDVGGPEVLTYRDMIERIAGLLGRRPRIVEVPVLTPRLSSYWLHLVTPVGAAVARPLIEGLRNETVVRDTRIRSLIPRDLTSFDVAARSALGQDAP